MSTWPTTGSYASVNSVVQASTTLAGDIVQIPAGPFDWGGSTLTISKGITLIGANGPPGSTPTSYGTGTINTTLSNAFFNILTSAGAQVRVSGLSIVGGEKDGNTGRINVDGTSNESINNGVYRLDNILFNGAGTGNTIVLTLNGNGPGLIDHCTLRCDDASEMIHNLGTGINPSGTGAAGDGWNVNVIPGGLITPGTLPQAVYIENCSFVNTGNAAQASGIQCYYGARTVVRYCQFSWAQIDVHGGNRPGGRWWEFYNNSFVVPAGRSQANTMQIRGGSGVVFNNTQSLGSGSSPGSLELWCDNGSGGDNNTNPPPWGPSRGWNSSSTDSPTSNQKSSPVYFWNNSSNQGIGSPNSTILLNRDYFVSPSQPPSGTMKIWQTSSDTASTTYDYVPFTYPYPLSGGGLPTGGSTPVAPVGLVQHVSFAANSHCDYVAGTPVPGNPFYVPFPNVTIGGNCLILCITNPVRNLAGTAVSSITVTDDKSNTWTSLTTGTSADSSMMSTVYAAFNAAAGTQKVTVTFFPSGIQLFSCQFVMSEFMNVAASFALGYDTGSAAAIGGTAIAAGQITPSQNGDLIYHYGCDTARVNPSNATLAGAIWTGMSAGTGFTLLSTDFQIGTFAQFQVQTTAGSVNPTLNVAASSGSGTFNTIAVALKASASTQGGPAPAGIRVQSLHHVNLYRAGTLQIPSSGNLLYVASAAGQGNNNGGLPAHITGVSSVLPANTWTQVPAPASGQYGGNGPPIAFYAANATTSNTLKITVTGPTSLATQTTVFVYDIIGAATSPFDVYTDNKNAQGIPNDFTISVGNFNVPSTAIITPTTANGLVIATQATYLGVLTACVQRLIACTYGNEADADLMSNADGVAIVYNASASAITFGWTLGGSDMSPNTSQTISSEFPLFVAFKAASGGGGGTLRPNASGSGGVAGAGKHPHRILRPFVGRMRF